MYLVQSLLALLMFIINTICLFKDIFDRYFLLYKFLRMTIETETPILRCYPCLLLVTSSSLVFLYRKGRGVVPNEVFKYIDTDKP